MINPLDKNHQSLEIIKKAGKSIFFVGMMGCGKSTIGKNIAQILKYDFFEMDTILEEKLQMSINEIFQTKGEEFFRNEENKLLDELITKKNAVISCGGGTFVNNSNIEKINQNGVSVFLNVDSKTLEKRLKNDDKRPLLKEQKIGNILLKRIPFYTQASVTVDITFVNIDKNTLQTIKEISQYLA